MTKRKDRSLIKAGDFTMKTLTIMAFLFTLIIQSALARQSIQPGEQSGIPERADVEKKMTDPKKSTEKKKEVRQNQEETDPVFYDSTTSPKEMEQKKLTTP